MKSPRNNILIKNIYWERIFLHLEMEGCTSDSVEFFFIGEKNKKISIELVEREIINEFMHISINIASVHNRSFLDNGRWQLMALIDGYEYICNIDFDVAYKLEDLSRVFKYAQNQMAYNFTIGVNSLDNESLQPYFDSYFLIENKSWKKRRYIKEVRTTKEKIKRFFMYASILAIRIYYHILYKITPKRGKNVMIMSETKDYLWGNLLFIDKAIKRRGLDKNFRLTYSYRKNVGKNQGFGDIFSWIKVTTKIAKQDVIFIDDYAPIFGFFKLGKKTKLVQVWHAGEGFKSVGYSRFGKEGSPFPQGSCHKQYTDVITGSENLIKVFQEVFAIEKEAFHPIGMARLDGFLDENNITLVKEKIYKEYKFIKDKFVMLFAPTYRGAEQKTAYYDYENLELDRLYRLCKNKNMVFLIKMHPFVKKKIQIPEKYKEYIMDISDYPDINQLYYVTDLLITDYSSNYYEYALMKKPVIFYTYDRKIYELTRGVHRSVEECAPGRICDTFEDVLKAIEDEEFQIEKIMRFVEENFKDYDGNAANKIIDEVLLEGK